MPSWRSKPTSWTRYNARLRLKAQQAGKLGSTPQENGNHYY